MSLDSQLKSENDEQYFALAYRAPVESQVKKEETVKPSLFRIYFNSFFGVANLAMGIPDALDLVRQEESYNILQYAGTAFELVLGASMLFFAFAEREWYKEDKQRSKK